MADQDHLANQVDADLAPLFTGLKPPEFPPIAQHMAARRPPRRRRARLSRLSLLGSAGALALAGVAAAALYYRAPATGPASPAPPTRAMSLTVAEAPRRAPPAAAAPAAPPAARTPTPRPDAPRSTVAEELGVSAAGPPQPFQNVATARPPAPAVQPALPPSRLAPLPRAPQPTVPIPQTAATPAPAPLPRPSGPEPPVRTEYAAQCTGPYCVDPAVVFADQALADAYYDAWQAGVPSRSVRAVQRSWRPLDREQTSSREAMLAAYDERIRDIRALTQTFDARRRRAAAAAAAAATTTATATPAPR